MDPSRSSASTLFTHVEDNFDPWGALSRPRTGRDSWDGVIRSSY
ncbi:hypothetical protein SAMN04488564_11111 [Lentzea waywayandensis]|uniref:Uncharacterized protein n=1 Tax=Lentzea waywayandensis TaxID=84724 RepID=A0A1I6FBJ8_9PSEU|nr:hypothetical protein SAMN04488564_11111 [Lentzea waywayandensis]